MTYLPYLNVKKIPQTAINSCKEKSAIPRIVYLQSDYGKVTLLSAQSVTLQVAKWHISFINI